MMGDLNFLDLMALAIVAVSAATALVKGLAAEVISLSSVVVGIFAAAFFYGDSAAVLAGLGLASPLAEFFGFVSLFVLAIVAGALVTRFVDRVLKTFRLKWADRLLGGAFGLVRGWLINVVIFLALTAFPVAGDLLENSKTAEIYLAGAGLLAQATPRELREKFKNGYESLSQIWSEQTKPVEPQQEKDH